MSKRVVLDTFGYVWIRLDTFGYVWMRLDTFGYGLDTFGFVFVCILDTFGYGAILDTFGTVWIRLDTVWARREACDHVWTRRCVSEPSRSPPRIKRWVSSPVQSFPNNVKMQGWEICYR